MVYSPPLPFVASLAVQRICACPHKKATSHTLAGGMLLSGKVPFQRTDTLNLRPESVTTTDDRGGDTGDG